MPLLAEHSLSKSDLLECKSRSLTSATSVSFTVLAIYAFLQMLAALLSDGGIALFAAPEEDFWGEPDGGDSALEADDGGEAESVLQPQRCVSSSLGGNLWAHQI